ncbi:MAG: hypothetical protein Tsb008_13700 [Rhodothalassiaceae bacterium]
MKSVASLSAALLARKGAAAPAMHSGPEMVEEADAHAVDVAPEAPRRFLAREPETQRFGKRGLSDESRNARKDMRPAEKVTDEKRIALTLRLDRSRHLGLKLLSAHLERSGQQILIELLDDLLEKHADRLGDCSCLQGIATECAGGGCCAK